MKKKDGVDYKTIIDASIELGISVSTIRRYIRNGTFPPPQREFFGGIGYAVFSDSYISEAKSIIKRIRSRQ